MRWLPDFLGSVLGLMVMCTFVRCRPGTVKEQARDWVSVTGAELDVILV